MKALFGKRVRGIWKTAWVWANCRAAPNLLACHTTSIFLLSAFLRIYMLMYIPCWRSKGCRTCNKASSGRTTTPHGFLPSPGNSPVQQTFWCSIGVSIFFFFLCSTESSLVVQERLILLQASYCPLFHTFLVTSTPRQSYLPLRLNFVFLFSKIAK